jgi:uncharacterized protein YecE (DUF72 family)
VARAYIGTSGWNYRGWRAHLYGDAPVRRWLEIAARTFGSLEINGSFYRQIAPATYQRWHDETPPEFRFALKGHRFITHYKRLRDCDASILRLCDQAAPLGAKLAAVVWQLPSHLALDLPRLEAFVAALAAWPTRHAIELRHASWFIPEVARVLARANVAACQADAPDFPMWRAVTADFVYARLHGHTRKYASRYSGPALRAWAAELRRHLAAGRDVHVYFDNDAEGHAVGDALRLAALVAGSAPPARRAGARSAPAPCGSERASPWRRPSARPGARVPSARRSRARTGSRGRPRGGR